jgi:PIN domain nuclease of toxin-antitoxin system
VRVLLDTHALLWWFVDDPRLSHQARAVIADQESEILVSTASAWELATKFRLGRLPEAEGAILRFAELVDADGFTHLPITHRHATLAGTFDSSHRDPFDRVLAAQAIVEGVPLLTRDPAFSQFPVQVLW